MMFFSGFTPLGPQKNEAIGIFLDSKVVSRKERRMTKKVISKSKIKILWIISSPEVD